MTADQLQAKFRTRFLAIKAGLLEKGFAYRPGVFTLNGVQVWVTEGNQSIQRHLGLTVKAYLRFTVKTVKTAHDDVFDDVGAEVSQVVEKLAEVAGQHARVLSLAS